MCLCSTRHTRPPTALTSHTQSTGPDAGTGGGAKPASSSSLKQEFLRAAPRDATHGVVEGVKSIGMGVVAGVGTLIGAPIMGAQQEGFKGFFKGLGVGLVGAVAGPVVGTVNGVGEMVGGVMNTPQALRSRLEVRASSEGGGYVCGGVGLAD